MSDRSEVEFCNEDSEAQTIENIANEIKQTDTDDDKDIIQPEEQQHNKEGAQPLATNDNSNNFQSSGADEEIDKSLDMSSPYLFKSDFMFILQVQPNSEDNIDTERLRRSRRHTRRRSRRAHRSRSTRRRTFTWRAPRATNRQGNVGAEVTVEIANSIRQSLVGEVAENGGRNNGWQSITETLMAGEGAENSGRSNGWQTITETLFSGDGAENSGRNNGWQTITETLMGGEGAENSGRTDGWQTITETLQDGEGAENSGRTNGWQTVINSSGLVDEAYQDEIEVEDLHYEEISHQNVIGNRTKSWRSVPKYRLNTSEALRQEADLYYTFVKETNHEEIISATTDDKRCCTCLANKATRVMIPCGHQCLCYNCAKSMAQIRTSTSFGDIIPKKCPICRAIIAQMIHPI